MVRPAAGSLNLSDLRHHLLSVAHAAIKGVEPGRLLTRTLQNPAAREWIESARDVDVIAAGKAAAPMLSALGNHLGRPWRSALAITPHPLQGPLPPGAEWMAGAHPIPDEGSEAAGREVLTRVSRSRAEDLLIVLISGGASSLMVVPVDGVPLVDKAATQRRLLESGASIDELNAVRKHLSQVKGGRLVAAARARVLTLAMSDVVGDDLSTIGSGPTVPDPTTFAGALEVLARYGGIARYPAPVVQHLQSGQQGKIADTLKKADDTRSRAFVTGSLGDALDAAEAAASALGFRVRRLREPIVGDARAAGGALLQRAADAAGDDPLSCVIAGGETTVRVTGQGRGGRNQELALSMALGLEDAGQVVAGSVGTDGVDGPTDAAGAIVDATTVARARARGLDPVAYLNNNNSYEFFDALGDLVRTGPTGTNVGDIQIVMKSSEPAVRP